MRVLRSIAFVLTVVASASVAEAQITTVVVPPRQPRAPRSAAVADSARAADSAAALQQRLTTMREWVDSAALALDAQPSVAAGDTAAGDTAAGDTAAGDTAAGDTAAGDTAAGDTAAGGAAAGGAAAGGAPPADAVVPAAPGVSGRLDSAAGEPAFRSAAREPTFREGATAPDTASALPLVLVLSGAAVGLGAALRRC